MKRIAVFLCLIILVTMLSACQAEPESPGFFNQTPSKSMYREDFYLYIKLSSKAESYGKDNKYHKIAFKDLVDIVGKPQRESPHLDGILPTGAAQTNPRCKCFIWELKNDMVISYDVTLSNDCPDEVATLENILEYGIVYNLYKVPLTVTVLPDGYFDSVPGDTGE